MKPLDWIKNIKRGPLTTVAAILIFVLTTIFILLKLASFAEVLPAWVIVLILLFAKDPGNKPPSKQSKAPSPEPKTTTVSEWAKNSKTTLIVLLLATLALTSCSPTARLKHLLKKYPYLQTDVIDTLHIDTTIYHLKPIEAFSIPLQGGTFAPGTMEMKGLNYNLQFYKDPVKDTIYITVEAKPDLVPVNIDIPYIHSELNTITKPNQFADVLKYGTWFILALIALYVAATISRLFERKR